MSDITIVTDTDESPFRCEVCGTALVYSGKGRHPKFCEEHRKGSSNTSSKGTAGIERIRTGMTDMYAAMAVGATGLGAMMQNETGNALMLDGQVLGANAPRLGDAWADLAKNDPKVRKALERMLTGSGWGKVILAHAIVAVGIAGNHGVKIPVPGMAASGAV